MTKNPAVIVEGKDDIKFYKNLCENIKKNIEVIAVDNIKGVADGCTGVIECIESIQDDIKKNINNLKYILGIIDGDVRCYRDEIPNNIYGIFVLKYYSYESHFVTRQNLKNIVGLTASVGKSYIDDKTLDYIEKDVQNDYKKIFYVSLEALKNACIKEYDSIISYKDKPEYIFNNLYTGKNIMKSLMRKKNQLDEFAKQYNITFSDFKKVIKGKWLLYTYYNSVYRNLKKLPDACRNNIITKCQYCKSGQPEKCLWNLDYNYKLEYIISIALNYYDNNELEYINDRLKQLA
ncbi:DUF4435 domain-containing protein [Clostridium cochlearium]|uniref:DUF4435 domain-containing protein n=2 Tax=Clostridium cochlearium TaxID=1494 RepID=A0A7Y3V533_CLOCO|nr:DUF4435 domain-containing protein [Clostridium cochlearium]NOH14850.1 DUF4435 domain-containing protein [Clostridium cochlearium]